MDLSRYIFGWCQGHRTVGFNGPQGAGKTTLVGQLVALYAAEGLRAVGLSIDDYYLTNERQRWIALQHRNNRYLQQRGYPGTHDVTLGEATLDAVLALKSGQSLALPTYDKSAHAGRGDRLPEAEWRVVEGPVDVVLLEGWMLGFQPVPAAAVAHDAALAEVNQLLARYESWHRRLGALVQLTMPDPGCVVRWRSEAEAAMQRGGRPGMSPAAIRTYVETFLPAYALYSDTVRTTAARYGIPYLSVALDAERRPIALPAEPPRGEPKDEPAPAPLVER